MFGTERWQAYGHQARIRRVYLGDANVMRQCLGVAYQHVGSGCEFVNDITCTIERRVQDYGLFAPCSIRRNLRCRASCCHGAVQV